MKKFCLFCIVAFCCSSMCSCYALLKAEKLVYQGTIAKKPVDVKVDSVTYTNVPEHE